MSSIESPSNDLQAKVAQALPGQPLAWSEFQGQLRLTIDAAASFEILKALRDHCGFDMLVDVTAVDYLEYPNAKDRYEVVYVLLKSCG